MKSSSAIRTISRRIGVAITCVLLSLISSYSWAQYRWGLNNDLNGATFDTNGFSTGDPVFTTDGVEGTHALVLNGTNQYVSLGNNYAIPGGFKSISVWAKTATLTGEHIIVSHGGLTNNSSLVIGQDGADFIAGIDGDEVRMENFWQVGVWHHIFFRYNGSIATVYIDGIEAYSEAKSWPAPAQQYAYLGRAVVGGRYWNGEVDDLRFINESLPFTATQIAEFGTRATAPSEFSVTPVSSASLLLNWTDNTPNETGFQLERSTTSGSGYVQIPYILPANTTFFQDDNLTPLTTYYYRIRVIADYSNSVFSLANGKTYDTPPYNPSALSFTVNSPTSVVLNWWDDPANETGFEIHRSFTQGTGYTLLASLPPNTLTYTDTNLEPGATYYYQVRAFNDGGFSNFGPDARVIIPIPAPAAPTLLTAAVVSAVSVTVNWTDQSDNESIFFIERSTVSGSGFAQIGYTQPNVSQYTDAGLTTGTTYYYRVRASNSGGESAYTNEVHITPTNLASTQLGAGLFADANGNLGIGTQVIPGGYRMAVNGKVMAEGVKVDLKSAWPDYVFESSYDLKDIAAIKEYINKNGHLPNIPSSEEVKKQGMDVAEINIKLLEKIEELTLYLIQMEERMDALEKENEKLKAGKNK